MTTFVALNGVHTAGKSTLGEMLAQEEHEYYVEVAQKLIDEEGADWGQEGDHRFQEKIHDREAKRDRELLREKDGDEVVLIETWHFGNIAHSEEVADSSLPEEQREYLEVLYDHTDADIYAVFLDMPLEEIWDRSPTFEEGETDILEFYDRVRDNHFKIYDEFDVDYTVIRTDEDIEDTYHTLREFVHHEAINSAV